jgi:hypothetical protein
VSAIGKSAQNALGTVDIGYDFLQLQRRKEVARLLLNSGRRRGRARAERVEEVRTINYDEVAFADSIGSVNAE